MALVRHGTTRAVFWAPGGLVWLALALAIAWTTDPAYGSAARAYGGVVYGAMGAGALCLLVIPCVTWANYRHFRRRLGPGSTWETRASEQSFTMKGPLGIEATVPFRALRTCRVVGDWVLVQQHGLRLWFVWPRALFDDPTLRQMQRDAGRPQR